jgi:hypothetical protein
MRWAGNVTRLGKRNAHRLLAEKSRGKETTRKTISRWMDNIKIDLGEIGLSSFDWIGLAQDWDKWRALVNAVMNLRVLE